MKNEFFIVGSPRSGTTLLHSMLAAHSEVAIPPETFFFTTTVPMAKSFLRSDIITNVSGFFKVMAGNKYMQPLLPYADRALFQDNRSTIGEVFSSLCGNYAKSRGKSIWGEKTPSHLWYWQRINRAFPNCKFIIVVRDGRDVVCSVSRVRWGTGNLYGDAYRWKIDIRKGEKIIDSLGPERSIMVRYEDLVVEPEVQMKRICDFLMVKYERDMVQNFANADIIHGMEEEWKRRNLDKTLHRESINRYKSDLGPKKIKYLNGLLVRELRIIGAQNISVQCNVASRAAIKIYASTLFYSMLCMRYARMRAFRYSHPTPQN